MGYRGKMTRHGFRSLGNGGIKERLDYRHEVVDRQLSHVSCDTYGEAYDRTMFLDERKAMMQQYADYLETVTSCKVTRREVWHGCLSHLAALSPGGCSPIPPRHPKYVRLFRLVGMGLQA
jgi:hypothetical protein